MFDFYRLAENRIKTQQFPDFSRNLNQSQAFPEFSTNLNQSDLLDDSLRDYMDGGAKCLEAFSRAKSFEDLMNI